MISPTAPIDYKYYLNSLCRAFTPGQSSWLVRHQKTKTRKFVEALALAQSFPNADTINIWLVELHKLTQLKEWTKLPFEGDMEPRLDIR